MFYIFFIAAVVIEALISSQHGDVIAQLQAWQIILLGFASFRGGVSISEDGVFSWLRAPICVTTKDGAGDSISPRYRRGWKHVVGEFMSCPICTGLHTASVLLMLYTLAPSFGLVLIYILAAGGLLEMLHSGREYLFWNGRSAREKCK